MLDRKLEAEVMDTIEEARDYDRMDHSEVNARFVSDLKSFLQSQFLIPIQPSVLYLDLGTGTAQIPIRLVKDISHVHIVGIDLAEDMLKLGRSNIRQQACEEFISLVLMDAKALTYPTDHFDGVISNSIIHHIPDPLLVLREMIRVLKPGGVLFVRDLFRPETEEQLESLVQSYAGGENEHQQQMFRDSLHAALTLEEVQQMLVELELPLAWVQLTSDRHWTLKGKLP